MKLRTSFVDGQMVWVPLEFCASNSYMLVFLVLVSNGLAAGAYVL